MRDPPAQVGVLHGIEAARNMAGGGENSRCGLRVLSAALLAAGAQCAATHL